MNRRKLWDVIWLVNSMADKFSPMITSGEVRDTIHELNEGSVCQEQSLEKVKNLLNKQTLLACEVRQENGHEMDYHQSITKISKNDSNQNRLYISLAEYIAWLRRIYRNHLKRYYIIRRVVHWTRCFGVPLYVRSYLSLHLFNRMEKRWRPLTKLSEYVIREGVETYILTEAVIVDAPEPNVFPTCEQSCLISPHSRYKFSEIFVAAIKNAMTYGGTNLIMVDGDVVCHDLYDFERDYTSEELHGRTLIDPQNSRIRWFLHDKEPVLIDKAAIFVDACATNYAHWITEVMPRIVLFCSDERYKGVPIVVNEGLHHNIMESLFLVAGINREIIILSPFRALVVNNLYLTSVTGYVPFGRRNNKLSGNSHGMFNPIAFEMFRKHINGLENNFKDYVWPERIFLRRNSGTRKVSNIDELEKLLVDRGYVIIETEKLTFLQQIQLFKHVKEIIAPTGAALANAIFCMPGTHVTILMGKHEDMIYRYWCNMLTPIQIKVSYVLGNITQNRDLGIHGDFLININDVIDLLEHEKK